MSNLHDPKYLSFPFRVSRGEPNTSGRERHVREQIEQVLFTNPKERVFRPDFGAGVKQLIFEPNNIALRENLRQRLFSSLSEALLGEVDPRSLKIEFSSENEKLFVLVEYQLATINRMEQHRVSLGSQGINGGTQNG